MRYRVDMEYGYASFDQADEAKAFDLYRREGKTLRKTRDLFDDVGEVIAEKEVSA